MRTNRTTNAFIVGLLAIHGLFLAGQTSGQPSTVAQSDTLISKLLTSSDTEYVLARDSALALPADGRALVIALLKSYGDVSRGAMIASIIETRVAFPELAAEFDQRLRDQVDHPRTTGASTKPIYHVWLPEAMDIDPLVIEGLAVLDLPTGLQSRLSDRLVGRRNPALINSMMYLADNGRPGAASKLAGLCRDSPQHHARVATFLEDFYRRSRAASRTDGLIGVVTSLRGIGGSARLAQVRSLIELERDLMPRQGFRPWDEAGIKDELAELLGSRRLAAQQVELAREAGRDEQTISRLSGELVGIEQSLALAQARWDAAMLWRTLLQSEELIQADLARAATPSQGP